MWNECKWQITYCAVSRCAVCGEWAERASQVRLHCTTQYAAAAIAKLQWDWLLCGVHLAFAVSR